MIKKSHSVILAAATLAIAPFAISQDDADGDRPDRGRGGRGFNFPLVTALDADKDGIISADEIKAASAALGKLDKDGDGALSRAEYMGERFGRRGGRGAEGGAEGGDRPERPRRPAAE